jgi:uncharacterized metal-binding protein YceD (DUF177 family)
MTAELSRPIVIGRLPDAVMVDADAAERAAVATRLRVPEVRMLRCRFSLRQRGAVVDADGVLEADVVQECVVSLEPVEQHVAERFSLRFVPEGRESVDDDPEAPDELPYRGTSIDLGEAAAEQLALALDPYPRHPDAVLEPAAEKDGDGDEVRWTARLRPHS